MRERLRRFAAVGLVATAVDVGLLALLVDAGWATWVADPVALAAAAAVALVLHRGITLRDDPYARWIRIRRVFALVVVTAGLVDLGVLSLALAVADGGDPAAVAADLGFEAMDGGELEAIVDGIIAAHPEDWAAFTSGDDKERKKKSGFFVGQVMKATGGQADGRAVNEVLARRAAG